LFRISTNVAYNHFRDEKYHNRNLSLDREVPNSRKREFSDGRKGVENALVEDVHVSEIRRAIASLPFKQRTAVLMHKYEEMDYAQIAAVLGCTPSAVKALMFRAYEQLREQLAHLA
jgi:RNA polymerase sigma-70 factor (ECF subfamily)